MNNKTVKYVSKQSENILLNRMIKEKGNGYIKKGTFTTEIIWGSHSYIVPKMDKNRQKSFKKGLFLFGMVRKDVKAFIKKNPEIKLPRRYSQIEYSKTIDERLFGKITATDLNHAYWRIALNLGIISPMTYFKGLPDEFKAVRLAALSTMGMEKKYQKIKGGKLVDEWHITKGDESMQKVYKLIRYTCYKYMYQVKKMLGIDFLCYKTDAIYYIDNKENRKAVNDFFVKKDLLVKQLD